MIFFNLVGVFTTRRFIRSCAQGATIKYCRFIDQFACAVFFAVQCQIRLIYSVCFIAILTFCCKEKNEKDQNINLAIEHVCYSCNAECQNGSFACNSFIQMFPQFVINKIAEGCSRIVLEFVRNVSPFMIKNLNGNIVKRLKLRHEFLKTWS